MYGLKMPGWPRWPGVDDIEAARLAAGLDDAFALVAGRFRRWEVRVRARACVEGMSSGLQRTTGWSLAEHAGESSPDGMQRLFSSARWDADLVRDDLRGYVTAALGDVDGVLVGDDTGFEKKGTGRRECSGSTPGPRGRSRTASSACSWPKPARRDGR